MKRESQMDEFEAIKIVEAYGCKGHRGVYFIPQEMKGKPEPGDFKKAADTLFCEYDYCFEYAGGEHNEK